MKNTLWTLVAIAALGAMGTTPAYAAGNGLGILCKLPVVGALLCNQGPGGGGNNPVPEPASVLLLAAGAGLVGAAAKRRRKP